MSTQQGFPINLNERRSRKGVTVSNNGLDRIASLDGSNALDDALTALDDFSFDEPDIRLVTLPDINISGKQLRTLSEEVIAALERANTPRPTLFVQSGKLATVETDESGNPKIRVLGVDELRGMMTRAANFYRNLKGGGTTAAHPPMGVVRDVFFLGSWPFPPIKGVVSTPIIRRDGSVLDTTGYDTATQLYYQPTPDLKIEKIPEHPTQEDVRSALETIDDIIHDFPYISEADRANACAAMLTPYIRALVGCVPMALIDAPRQGTGKGLHADILSIIQTGHEAPVTPPPTDEAEWSKTITSLLYSGQYNAVKWSLPLPMVGFLLPGSQQLFQLRLALLADVITPGIAG